ncbi:MAG: hypothetical protein ABIQ76_11455 [Candidatus Limnocylindrales bacterium]
MIVDPQCSTCSLSAPLPAAAKQLTDAEPNLPAHFTFPATHRDNLASRSQR